MAVQDIEDVLGFWLSLEDEVIYTADPRFDEALRTRFGDTHAAAAHGDLDHWQTTARGALALTIVLDQFSRNLGRGSPAMFENDARALGIAKVALAKGRDQELEPENRIWFYLPFMHSENLDDQNMCVELCRQPGCEKSLPHAIEHMQIIERFGRFPHRNDLLGRRSSKEERQFLEGGGFSG